MSERLKVALVSYPWLGWKSVRKRWEECLGSDPSLDFLSIHAEKEAPGARRLYDRTGRLYNLWYMLASRASAKKAIQMGFDRVIVTNLESLPMVPKTRGVRYWSYADATAKQLEDLNYQRSATSQKSTLATKLLGINRHDIIFLCWSDWYRQGLIEEFGVERSRTNILFPSVETDRWVEDGRDRSGVLFVGMDFERKGGPIVRSIASRTHNQSLHFTYVTREKFEPRLNETLYNGFPPDSPELVALFQKALVFILPTNGDCTPLVTVEAAATGLPCIVARTGGSAELVLHNKTGTVIDTQDESLYDRALQRYMNDPQLAGIQGKAGRERAEREFSLKVQIANLKRFLT